MSIYSIFIYTCMFIHRRAYILQKSPTIRNPILIAARGLLGAPGFYAVGVYTVLFAKVTEHFASKKLVWCRGRAILVLGIVLVLVLGLVPVLLLLFFTFIIIVIALTIAALSDWGCSKKQGRLTISTSHMTSCYWHPKPLAKQLPTKVCVVGSFTVSM